MREAAHHQQKTAKPTHRGLSRFLGFLLTISLFVTVGAFLTRQTVLNVNYVTNTLTSSQNLSAITKATDKQIQTVATENGLPSELTKDLVTKADIKTDLTTTVTNLYHGDTTPLSTSTISTQLTTNLNNVAAENSLTLSSTVQALIQPFINSAAQKVQTKISDQYSLKKVVAVLHDAEFYTAALFWGGLVVSLALGLWLFIMAHLSSFCRYFGGAAFWAGLLWVLLGFMGTTAVAQNIVVGTIENTDVANIAQQLITGVSQTYMLGGAIALVVGLVLWLFSLMGRRR
ncbi:hypothetical protein IV38_GL001244 [Lactobacillus selangorensis]|uniref:Uncharacterized protein n=1 Tax=Lactobacillus selangorensis TaxID=81857 RepID=A0A0R2FRN5_9LACO|nr:hypothetical protein [Lactobacillus selangorensis]KRN29029.1 hypothetical protein IV38_GL001244 [Lactobacillus selangorensis]KRN32561.1 hypothetical protein IV40_GL000609 [Lactobacillus selangorensis]